MPAPSMPSTVVMASAENSRSRPVDWLLARPLILWSLYLVAVVMLGTAAKALFPDVSAGPNGLGLVQLGLQFVMLLAVLPFALRLGGSRLGLTRGLGRRHAIVVIFPAATVAFGYAAGIRDIALSAVLLAVGFVIAVALTEEIAFRGVLLHSLARRGVWPAVVISSLLFGLLHLANLTLGASWQATMLQVCFAAMAGTGYAAMRLRTDSLWPAIVLHAMYDLTYRVGMIEAGSWFGNAVHMLHGVGWLIYAVIALRKGQRARLQTARL